jgi:3D (Asp-Asp-Asp) domain-containing protein
MTPSARRRTRSARNAASVLLCLTLQGPLACVADAERTLVVQASAYNSLPGQTEGDPTLGAWGDELRPGMKVIAVSRDLLEEGLARGTRVRIEGVPGEWRVLDKMPRRWKRKIDLYMGEDVEAARAWGVRRVRIHWTPDAP